MYGDKHIVLGAPTGCGKTAVLELAILRLIMTRSENGILPTTVKIVYSKISICKICRLSEIQNGSAGLKALFSHACQFMQC